MKKIKEVVAVLTWMEFVMAMPMVIVLIYSILN